MDVTTTTRRTEIPAETFAGVENEMPSGSMFRTSEENPCGRDCVDLLCKVGLRPTRQRLLLGKFLFSKGGCHVTAEMLHTQAVEANIHISLATVYNTLNQFTEAGLLRKIGIDGSKSFFDTNPTTHHHFFVDQEDRLLDVPAPGVEIELLPQPLPGYQITRVDVVVHLRRKQG